MRSSSQAVQNKRIEPKFALTHGPSNWVTILLQMRLSCAIVTTVLSEMTPVDNMLTNCNKCWDDIPSNTLKLTRLTRAYVSILYSKVHLQIASYVKLAYVFICRAVKRCGLVLKLFFDKQRMFFSGHCIGTNRQLGPGLEK